MDKTIVFSSSVAIDVLGGGEYWNINLAKHLQQNKYKIVLISRPNSLLAREFKKFTPFVYDLNFSFDFNPVAILKTIRILKKEKADFLISNFNKDLSIAGKAARICNLKKIIFRNGYPILHKKWKHKLLLDLFDIIITNSKKIKTKYINYNWNLNHKIHVLHNGFRLDPDIRKRLFKTKEHYHILGVGRLTTVKGFDLFLKTLLNLKKLGYNYSATILGDGPEMGNIKTFATENNLNINMPGYISDIKDYLKKVDIFLHCSREEGMPNVILEAMSHYVPVVASDAGSTNELIEDNTCGILVKKEGDFTSAVISLINNEDITNQRIENAALKVKNEFDFKKCIDEFIDLLKS